MYFCNSQQGGAVSLGSLWPLIGSGTAIDMNGGYGFVDRRFSKASTDSSVKAEALLSLYQAGREKARAVMW